MSHVKTATCQHLDAGQCSVHFKEVQIRSYMSACLMSKKDYAFEVATFGISAKM